MPSYWVERLAKNPFERHSRPSQTEVEQRERKCFAEGYNVPPAKESKPPSCNQKCNILTT